MLRRSIVVCAFAAGALAFGRADAEEPFSLAAWGLKGQVVYKNFAHFDTVPHDNRHVRNEGLLQVEWERRLAWGAAKLVVDARADDDGYARGVRFDVPDTDMRRSHVDVREATVTGRRGPVDVTLGKQVYAWGTADAFNPTDNLNPYDYLDVLDNEKLGIWSASGKFTAGPASLVVAVVPVFTPSRLPLPDSRWTPVTPPGLAAIVDERQLPDGADAIQYAARLRTTVRGWDVSASYYDGFESTPAFRASTVTIAPGLAVPRLTPVFSRIRVPGVDVSTTVGPFEWHAEAVARLVDEDGRDDRFRAIAGFNYTKALAWRWLDQLTVVLEYAREVVLATHRSSGIVGPGEAGQVGDLLANNAFREAVVGRVLFKLTQDTAVEVTGHADLHASPSHLIQARVRHAITSALSVEAGVDVLTGEPASFWGRWRDNDRTFLAVKYLF